MKTKIIYTLVLAISVFNCYAQSDIVFSIRDSVISYSSIIDENSNLHLVYSRFKKRNNQLGASIFYTQLDSLGNKIVQDFDISNSLYSSDPDISKKKSYEIIVWRETSPFLNSYIYGQILKDCVQYGPIIKFNDEYYDAERFSPQACFIDDTTFIVTWSGHGPQTTESIGLYAQKYNIILGKIGQNILITDHISSNVDNKSSRIIISESKIIFTWIDNSSGKNQIWLREFDKTLNPLNQSRLVTDTMDTDGIFYYDISNSSTNTFSIAWSSIINSRWEVRLKTFRNDLTVLDNKIITTLDDSVLQYSSVGISYDLNRRGVIVWEGLKDNIWKIYAMKILNIYSPLDKSYLVNDNSNTTNEEYFPSTVIDKSHVYYLWLAYSELFIEISQNDIPLSVNHDDSNDNLPEDYFLFQNYPNPFNPTTLIKFTIKQSGKVTLKVFDVLGREVAELLITYHEAGNYEIPFDGSNLPSGVYFYNLSSNGNSLTKKMLLLK